MGQPKHENEINQSELKASAGKKRWGQVTIGFDWSWKRSRKQQVCCDWLRDAPVFFLPITALASKMQTKPNKVALNRKLKYLYEDMFDLCELTIT